MSDKFEDRLIRQKDIVPIPKLANRTVQVIGVGGIGRQVALQLGTMGVQNLLLVDDDKVEAHNFGVQGFPEDSLGMLKVDAVKRDILRANSSVNVETIPTKFKESDKHGSIIFCCVDSMAARKKIWYSVKDGIELYIDGRMLGLTGRILTVFDNISAEYYESPSVLFSDEEASEGRCTEKSTFFLATCSASLMVNNLARWMRNKWTEKNFSMRRVQDVIFNLVTPQLTTYGE